MRFLTRPVEPPPNPLSLEPDAVWMSPHVSLFGWGEMARIRPGSGTDRLNAVATAFEKLIGEATLERVGGSTGGPVVMASTTFAVGSPGSLAIVPRTLLAHHDDEWTLTTADGDDLPSAPAHPPPPTDRARYAGSSLPDVRWLEAVAEAIRRIEAGSIEKVVLARDYAVWSRQPFHPPRLLDHLRSRFPSCYVYSVAGLMGASPELLVRRRQGGFESLVLAGSAPTLADPGADREVGEALLDSKKDLWEHELSVRSVTRTLAALGIDCTSTGPRLLHLDNVQHLATEISAAGVADLDVLRLAEALHPTAAVGGTPTHRALEVIAELEGMDRGRYAGPVGWMDGAGDGEVAIALRCAELSGARARLFAGAGIVAGSYPEMELEETRVKLAAMMGALAAG